VARPRVRSTRLHILYMPGGAFVSPAIWAHWGIVEQLVRATGATVTVANYPLAPEHDHRAAYAFLMKVYQDALKTSEPQHIVLCGDSAGGGAALSLATQIRDLGLPQPSRLILFAPWLDLTLADPLMEQIEPKDPDLCIKTLRICGNWWAGEDNPCSPYLSPLYGDASNLPPMDIFVGDLDLLVVDCRTYAQRVRDAGGALNYTEVPGAFHVYVGATWTPEAKSAYRSIASRFARPMHKADFI